MVRRQFRKNDFRAPKKPVEKAHQWRSVSANKVAETSLPTLDLTRFMKLAHTDDHQGDEAGFEEFGVHESIRDVVRSLRQVVHLRLPKQRTVSQRIKDLVLNSRPSQICDAVRLPTLTSGPYILRIDNLTGNSGKILQDSVRYMLRDLAVTPDGILAYPCSSNDGLSTVFVEFDTWKDFNSGMSQMLRLRMKAEECTVDELATFHVLHSLSTAAKQHGTLTPRTPMTVVHSALPKPSALKGSRLSTADSIRTPRSPRLRAQCSPRVPDLSAVGSSRPCTAPTSSSASFQPLMLRCPVQRRPETTQYSTRPQWHRYIPPVLQEEKT